VRKRSSEKIAKRDISRHLISALSATFNYAYYRVLCQFIGKRVVFRILNFRLNLEAAGAKGNEIAIAVVMTRICVFALGSSLDLNINKSIVLKNLTIVARLLFPLNVAIGCVLR